MTDYPLATIRWEGKWVKGYLGFISATDAENIAILGPGRIIGTDAIRIRNERGTGYRNPPLLEFVNCKWLRIEDLRIENAAGWTMRPPLATAASSVAATSGTPTKNVTKGPPACSGLIPPGIAPSTPVST